MKKVTLLTAMLAIFVLKVSYPASAAMTVIDFEEIPDMYLYFGGGQNLGDYYPGLFFGPDVVVADRVRYGYNDVGFPPHSGDAIIASASEDTIRIDFTESTASYVEAWYSSTSTLFMEGYDAGDNLLVSTSAPSSRGTNSLISISANDIAYITIHDSGNLFGIDDLGYIPEPATLVLLSLGGLLIRKRK